MGVENLATMPRKEFPQISSLPSFRNYTLIGSTRRSENIPMRSIETDNLKDLSLMSSPFTIRQTYNKNNSDSFTPISVSSSDDEDEKHDKVGGKVL